MKELYSTLCYSNWIRILFQERIVFHSLSSQLDRRQDQGLLVFIDTIFICLNLFQSQLPKGGNLEMPSVSVFVQLTQLWWKRIPNVVIWPVLLEYSALYTTLDQIV